MPRSLALLAALALTASASSAQGRVDVTGAVTGAVTDSTGAGLRGATVVLLLPADSTIASFAATDADGAFRIRRVPAGAYLLKASFVGFVPAVREIRVGAGPLDVGRVALAEDAGALGQLVVGAERVPMVVRQDTLEYDAGAFGTPMGATVEDLLKRLPGVEVGADGSIKAQGEAVRKVLVDGKEFFGDDPTVATRNLPADAVDRVQVYDKASDTAEFTGVKDGDEARTINLALKEDRKTGAFGTVSGGLGGAPTDGAASGDVLYDGKATVNRFSPATQLSAIANVNNVNRQSFSVGDYFSFMGGPPRMGGGGVFRLGGDGVPVGDGPSDGFATTLSGGLNLNHEFSAKTSVQSSYFVHHLDAQQTRRVVQDRFFGDALSSREEQDGDQDRTTTAHRLSVTAEHEIGEGHDLRVRSNVSLADAALASTSQRQTVGAAGLENGSTSAYGSDGRDLAGDAALTYRRRFAGNRSVVADLRAGLQDNRLDGDLRATNRFYDAGDLLTTEELAQLQDQDGRAWTRSARVLLTQPLGASQALQLGVERQVTTEDQTREVSDVTGAPALDDALSSAFERSVRTDRGGLTYRYDQEPVGLSVGLDLQRVRLDGEVLGAGGAVDRQFLRLLPSATLSYAISQGRNAELRYRAQTREPSLRELQPVVDNRDPLDVYVGNPELQPETTHSVDARYLSFDAFTSTNLFGFVRAAYTTRSISTARTVDERLRQTSTPVNTGGTWTVMGNASFGTPVRPLRGLVNLSANTFYDRGLELVNGAENASDLWRTTLDLRLENRDKERLDLQVGARYAFNNASYALSPQRDRAYVNRTFYAELGWTPTDAWDLRTKLDLTLYADDVFGEGRVVPLWEATASRSFMDGRAQVELVARDLLDRNVGVSFTNTPSYVQEERVDSLGRYVLLRLVYNLSSGGPRPGGGIRLG